MKTENSFSKQKKYRGVVVPMITPFTKDEFIDHSSAEKIVDHIVKTGAHIFVLGTTGESASIPELFKLLFVETVSKRIDGKIMLYAGISGNCVETSIEAAKRYSDMGVNLVVAHLPSYYPINADHMFKYYETLANRIPIPLMIYNIPATTHLSIPLNIIEKLSHHPNIVGLKDSERDIDRLEKAIQMWEGRSDFSHFVGWGAQCAYALLSGSDGIVPSTGNLIPKQFQTLYNAAKQGDKNIAHQIQKQTDIVAEIYQKDRLLGESLASLKVMMHELNLCESWVLPPLIRLNSEEETHIKKKMQEIGILKTVLRRMKVFLRDYKNVF